MTFTEKVAKLFGGLDKVVHFGVGGLICSLITLLLFCIFPGILTKPLLLLISPILGDLVVLVLSFYKEFKIDPEVSYRDIWASLIGCVPVHLVVILGMFIVLIFR